MNDSAWADEKVSERFSESANDSAWADERSSERRSERSSERFCVSLNWSVREKKENQSVYFNEA